jgi:hypothetical protein
MNRPGMLAGALLIALGWPLANAWCDDRPLDVFDKQPALRATPLAEVQSQALAWLDGQTADPALRQQAVAVWATADEDIAPDPLDRLAATFALVDPRAAALVAFCSGQRPGVELPPTAWLAEDGLAPLVRDNLRLYVGRWLARERLYDESLAHLGDLAPSDVIDPATLLFYQGAAHHWLLHREPGLKALDRLLNDVADAPRRYTSVGQLMLADLRALEDESLDHIARRMDDIDRRLDLGHAGPRVRKVEDGVIESLDKLIEQLEEQQKQQQQQSAGGGSGTLRPSNPAQDSVPMGGKGPGETNRRDIGDASGWGDLPPKERQEALQQIGKDFPAHYRDVIEQYFRKLAGEGESAEGPP